MIIFIIKFEEFLIFNFLLFVSTQTQATHTLVFDVVRIDDSIKKLVSRTSFFSMNYQLQCDC